MSSRMGRPLKEVTKSVTIGIRITPQTADTLQKCADALHIPRAVVIERGIDLIAAGIFASQESTETDRQKKKDSG